MTGNIGGLSAQRNACERWNFAGRWPLDTETVNLFPDFREFLKLLNEANARYLLVGGYAVNYYGHHRTTGDLDIWIAIDSENAERISTALQLFAFPSESVPSELFLDSTTMFRFGRKPVQIELLTTLSGVDFSNCYAKRTVVDFDGIAVPIIAIDDLKANKKASARPKDIDDLLNLP